LTKNPVTLKMVWLLMKLKHRIWACKIDNTGVVITTFLVANNSSVLVKEKIQKYKSLLSNIYPHFDKQMKLLGLE